MRLISLLMAAAIVSGCTTANNSQVTYSKPGSGEIREVPREALIGTWYGLQPTKDGTEKEWITHRSADGSFMARFREKKEGRVLDESNEVGEWGLSYDFEVVITRGWMVEGKFRPAPANAYFWDLYQIVHVDQEKMVYVHHGTDHHYEVRRVADDFEFPAPSPQKTAPVPRE